MRQCGGADKTPPVSCELVPAVPAPPPCHLHRNNRLRSHPLHFASTAPLTPPHLSRSKCSGVCPVSLIPDSPRMEVLSHLSALFLSWMESTSRSMNHFWAVRIISRSRSFLLSINSLACAHSLSQDDKLMDAISGMLNTPPWSVEYPTMVG